MKSLGSVLLCQGVCLCFLYAAGVVAGPSAPPVVDLGYTKVQGFEDYETNITSYLGVRYAAPPIGDLRWRAPQPPVVQPGIQNATTQPEWCAQFLYTDAPVNFAGSEDCLFLNVFTPSKPASTKPLPVILWIHGGGYNVGWISMFPGRSLIHHGENEVVVVMIQYRLGLLGFLAGKDVKANGALNAALLDQEFAMKWVQEHISKFGGDPNQVAIWGESAGAGSVLQQLLAHDGKTTPPLFQRAIMNSVFLPPQHRYDDPKSETIYEAVVNRTGCASSEDVLTCLRSADLSSIMDAANDIRLLPLGVYPIGPVIDGEFITQSPIEALKEKKVNSVEGVLSTTNINEGAMFINPGGTINASEYILSLFPRMSKADAERGAKLYEGMDVVNEQHSAIHGESIFICPSHFLMRGYAGSKAFSGTFAVPPGIHFQDTPYYFTDMNLDFMRDVWAVPPLFENEPFKKAFAGSHVSVARFADPNTRLNAGPALDEDLGILIQDQELLAVQNAQKAFNPNITDSSSTIEDILPEWEAYGPRNFTMWFGKTHDDQPDVRGVETDSALLERCRFWESVASTTAQ